MEKSVQIVIKDNTYTVGFPNTGQYMDIRSLKSQYVRDLSSFDVYDAYAVLLAEMIATYNIMIPELKKHINVDSIFKLDMVQSKELLDSYTDVYKPFFDKWMQLITKSKEKESEATTNA